MNRAPLPGPKSGTLLDRLMAYAWSGQPFPRWLAEQLENACKDYYDGKVTTVAGFFCMQEIKNKAALSQRLKIGPEIYHSVKNGKGTMKERFKREGERLGISPALVDNIYYQEKDWREPGTKKGREKKQAAAALTLQNTWRTERHKKIKKS